MNETVNVNGKGKGNWLDGGDCIEMSKSKYSRTFKQRVIDILEEANELGHHVETALDRALFADFLISKGICLCNVDLAQAFEEDKVVSVTFPIQTSACQVPAYANLESYKQQNDEIDEYDLRNLVRYINDRDYEKAINTILKHEELTVGGGAGIITQIDRVFIRCDAWKATEFFAAIICGADDELDHYTDVLWHYTLKRVRDEGIEYNLPPEDAPFDDNFAAMIRDKLTLSRITFRALCVAVTMALLYFDNDDLRADLGLDDDFWNVLPKSTVQIGGNDNGRDSRYRDIHRKRGCL